MPARTKKIRHDENTRAKIKAALIINRLMDHVTGKLDLTPAQVSSAKTLLAKVLPDLQSVEMTGEVVQRVISEAPMTAKDWGKQFDEGEHRTEH